MRPLHPRGRELREGQRVGAGATEGAAPGAPVCALMVARKIFLRSKPIWRTRSIMADCDGLSFTDGTTVEGTGNRLGLTPPSPTAGATAASSSTPGAATTTATAPSRQTSGRRDIARSVLRRPPTPQRAAHRSALHPPSWCLLVCSENQRSPPASLGMWPSPPWSWAGSHCRMDHRGLGIANFRLGDA